jgi:NAD(P)-dependent dehydrogenase (short-subunit alcohol dehydrogenase family)
VIVGRGLEKGQAVAKSITAKTDVPVEMVAADLGNIEDVGGIIPAADKRFGRVDILVNAAGLTDRGNVLNTTPELFDRMFAVNTRAPFFLMQDAAKLMIRDGIEGRIVNIGSMSGLAGQPVLAPYAGSKGALATLPAELAQLLTSFPMRVAKTGGRVRRQQSGFSARASSSRARLREPARFPPVRAIASARAACWRVHWL